MVVWPSRGTQLGWDDKTYVRHVHATRADDGATTVTVGYDVGAAVAVERAGLADKGRGAVYVSAHLNTINRLLQSLYGLERAPQDGFEVYAHTTAFPMEMSLDEDLDWMLERRVQPLGEQMTRTKGSLGNRLAHRCEVVDDATAEAGMRYAFAEAARTGRETPDTPEDDTLVAATQLCATFYERAGGILDHLALSPSDWALALYRCRNSGYNGFTEHSGIFDADAKELCRIARSF